MGKWGDIFSFQKSYIYSASEGKQKKKKEQGEKKTPGQAEISITARQHEIKVYHYSPGSR